MTKDEKKQYMIEVFTDNRMSKTDLKLGIKMFNWLTVHKMDQELTPEDMLIFVDKSEGLSFLAFILFFCGHVNVLSAVHDGTRNFESWTYINKVGIE